MKKRIFCLTVMLVMLFSACASERSETIDQPFKLYFLNESATADNGTLYELTVSMNVEEMSLEQIVQEYLGATPPQGTKRAFPTTWKVESIREEDGIAEIRFYGTKMTTIECRLAAACLTKTLSQLPRIEAVHLGVPGESELICLTDDEILLEDTAMLPQKETIVLFVPDGSYHFLVKQVQTVEAVETVEKPSYIMQRLLALPTTQSCIAHGTQLLSISVENGLCRVNLSSEFVTGMERNFAAERLAVYSIVNSLTELPEITTVDIWIEGTPLDRLSFLKLPAGMERDESVMASTVADVVELYLPYDFEGLVAVPYQIEKLDDTELYKQLIQTLIEFESAQGVQNYIPKGTKLLNLRMEKTACIIDLSGEFLTECRSDKEEALAVYSIVATLSAIDGITSVEILVEGLEPNYRNGWLRNVRWPDNSWFIER